MTPGRTSVSDFRHIASYGWESDRCIGENDPFWGEGVEESSAVSTLRWGAVSTVPPEYRTGVVALPADICQVSLSDGESSPEPQQLLTRKRPRKVEQAEALPSVKKPADRTVQIAGFTWQLPPDPGRGRAYPSLVFLIGAAISSSESGMMKVADIGQWIKTFYPSMSALKDRSISYMLSKKIDFINTATGKHCKPGTWKLRNPQLFGGIYQKNIFKCRAGIALERVYRNASPAVEQGAARTRARAGTDGDTHPAPALPVIIGSYTLMLPPYEAGQQRPPLRLLCGCAIALGSEQGSSVTEIVEWIAGRYSSREDEAMKVLKSSTSRALRRHKNDFRRTDIREQVRLVRGRLGVKWVLRNPSAFAADHEGSVYGGGGLSTVVSPDRTAGAVEPPGGIRQVPISESEPSPELQQRLARKLSGTVERAVVLPHAEKPADRTAQIAGFSWQLPPDPGARGPYPSIAFLIGAAISSGERGMMRMNEIVEWVRARYPSYPASVKRSIANLLSKAIDFTNTRTGKYGWVGEWSLRDPQAFGSHYQKNIFLKRPPAFLY